MSSGNSWPGGQRRALDQSEHERWNASNYPGTRQMCCECDEPTTFCEEDGLWIDNADGDRESGPYCEECYDKLRAETNRNEEGE